MIPRSCRPNLALFALSCLCLVSRNVGAQIDLTPHESTYELDGVTMTNIVFRDGKNEITYSPPKDWRVSGKDQQLTLVPNAIANTDARVEVTTTPTPVPFNEANLKSFVARAQKSAPRDAQQLQVLGTRLNPLKICGHDTLAVEIQYEAFGATYRSHTLFLNRDQQVWSFRFTSTASQFPVSFEPFRKSLYSLSGL